MRQYRGYNVGGIPSKTARQILQGMDVYLRQVSRQLSLNDTSDSSTAGNLSSIAANGGTKVTGDLTFSSTPTISLTNVGQDFTWDIVALPAVVFSTISGLDATTSLSDGSGTLAARSNHTHSIASGAQTGGYGTAATVGAGANFLRASGILPFPEALGTLADRTDNITLTDDGTEGALLTSSNTFTVSRLGLQAPGTSSLLDPSLVPIHNPLRIYPDGGISIGGTRSGTAAIDLVWSGSDAGTWQGVDVDGGQTGAGPLVGMTFAMAMNPAAANANNNAGMIINMNMVGANATGAILGCTVGFNASGVASRGDHIAYRNTVTTLLNNTSTNITSYQANDSLNALGGTCTNWRSFHSTNLRIGTNRMAFDSVGASGGAPTTVYNFRGSAHSVGTNRWGMQVANKIENTATDFIASTAGKGYICKDSQGTPEYWRMYTSISGTTVKDATWTTDADGFAEFTRAASATGSVILNLQDTGTTAPTA